MHCTFMVNPVRGTLSRGIVKSINQQSRFNRNRLIRTFSAASQVEDEAIRESARVLKCVCHYTVLELNRDANEQAIKAAYLAKTKQLHPDVCDVSSAVEAFRKVADAYAILSSPAKRIEYDQRFVSDPRRRSNPYSSHSSTGYNYRAASYGDDETTRTRQSTEGADSGQRRYEYYNGQQNTEYGSQYHGSGYSYDAQPNRPQQKSGSLFTPVLTIGACILFFASGFGFTFLDKVTGVDQEIKRLDHVEQLDQIRRQKKVAPGAIEKAVAPDGVVSDTPGVMNARFNLLEKDFEKNKIVIGLEINKYSAKYQRLMGEPEHIKIINKFLSKKWKGEYKIVKSESVLGLDGMKRTLTLREHRDLFMGIDPDPFELGTKAESGDISRPDEYI